MFSFFFSVAARRTGLARFCLARCAAGFVAWCVVWPAAFAQSLSLDEALKAAVSDAPMLAAQQASVSAARQMAVGSLENPDPKLKFGLENLPVSGADQFRLTPDNFTMRRVGIAQDFVREEKRKLKSERFGAEAQREEATLADKRALIRRDAAIAFFELQHAGAAAGLISALKREAQTQYDVLVGQVRAGRASLGDAIGAQSAVRALDDRAAEYARNGARARLTLARWIGAQAERPLVPYEWKLLKVDAALLNTHLHNHPHLAALQQSEASATADAALAKAQNKPDWGMEVSYAQRGPSYSNMVSVLFSIDLPAFGEKRIGADIAAKQAVIEQARLAREDARLAHELEAKLALADWDSATRRRANFDVALLPIADDRVNQALAAYRGGTGQLTQVLDARRGVLETRLAQLQLELDAARAWSQLLYFLPIGTRP